MQIYLLPVLDFQNNVAIYLTVLYNSESLLFKVPKRSKSDESIVIKCV